MQVKKANMTFGQAIGKADKNGTSVRIGDVLRHEPDGERVEVLGPTYLTVGEGEKSVRVTLPMDVTHCLQQSVVTEPYQPAKRGPKRKKAAETTAETTAKAPSKRGRKKAEAEDFVPFEARQVWQWLMHGYTVRYVNGMYKFWMD